MEISITTISPNGQVVIPRSVRKEANILPSTKFLVFQENGIIILKKLVREHFGKDLALAEKIAKAERQIQKGEYISVDSKMPVSEMHRTLMEKKWSSSSAKRSTRSTRKSRT